MKYILWSCFLFLSLFATNNLSTNSINDNVEYKTKGNIFNMNTNNSFTTVCGNVGQIYNSNTSICEDCCSVNGVYNIKNKTCSYNYIKTYTYQPSCTDSSFTIVGNQCQKGSNNTYQPNSIDCHLFEVVNQGWKPNYSHQQKSNTDLQTDYQSFSFDALCNAYNIKPDTNIQMYIKPGTNTMIFVCHPTVQTLNHCDWITFHNLSYIDTCDSYGYCKPLKQYICPSGGEFNESTQLCENNTLIYQNPVCQPYLCPDGIYRTGTFNGTNCILTFANNSTNQIPTNPSCR